MRGGRDKLPSITKAVARCKLITVVFAAVKDFSSDFLTDVRRDVPAVDSPPVLSDIAAVVPNCDSADCCVRRHRSVPCSLSSVSLTSSASSIVDRSRLFNLIVCIIKRN